MSGTPAPCHTLSAVDFRFRITVRAHTRLKRISRVKRMKRKLPAMPGNGVRVPFSEPRAPYYIFDMESIIRNVRDLPAAERDVLEQVIGRKLADGEQLVIGVVSPGKAAGSSDEVPPCSSTIRRAHVKQIPADPAARPLRCSGGV